MASTVSFPSTTSSKSLTNYRQTDTPNLSTCSRTFDLAFPESTCWWTKLRRWWKPSSGPPSWWMQPGPGPCHTGSACFGRTFARWRFSKQHSPVTSCLIHLWRPSFTLSIFLRCPISPLLHPYTLHNRRGQPRITMPTLVSFPRSHAFRPKANGAPGEGQL